MGTSILIFILLVVVFALLYKATSSVLGSVLGKTVHQRHKAAEHIIETGRLPASWQSECAKKSDAKACALGRIDDLVKYFERAPVFDTEETRRELLSDLEHARETWESLSWEELTREPDGDASTDGGTSPDGGASPDSDASPDGGASSRGGTP